jgi:hypothetical protein
MAGTVPSCSAPAIFRELVIWRRYAGRFRS